MDEFVDYMHLLLCLFWMRKDFLSLNGMPHLNDFISFLLYVCVYVCTTMASYCHSSRMFLGRRHGLAQAHLYHVD